MVSMSILMIHSVGHIESTIFRGIERVKTSGTTYLCRFVITFE